MPIRKKKGDPRTEVPGPPLFYLLLKAGFVVTLIPIGRVTTDTRNTRIVEGTSILADIITTDTAFENADPCDDVHGMGVLGNPGAHTVS